MTTGSHEGVLGCRERGHQGFKLAPWHPWVTVASSIGGGFGAARLSFLWEVTRCRPSAKCCVEGSYYATSLRAGGFFQSDCGAEQIIYNVRMLVNSGQELFEVTRRSTDRPPFFMGLAEAERLGFRGCAEATAPPRLTLCASLRTWPVFVG